MSRRFDSQTFIKVLNFTNNRAFGHLSMILVWCFRYISRYKNVFKYRKRVYTYVMLKCLKLCRDTQK